MLVNEIVTEIKKKIEFYKHKSEKFKEGFIIKDLFEEDEWESFDVKDRRKAGKIFLDDVKNGRIDGIIAKNKNSANAQIYKFKE